MTKPDWTTLPSDLIERIGDLLISDDLVDFIRLRAVCHPWRSSTEEMKSCVNCLHPCNWIMLSDPGQSFTKPWFFYNTSMNKYFSFDLKPYLESYSLLRAFDRVFLLKKNSNDQGLALLNPFMRSITQLPSKIESKCVKAPLQIQDIFFNPFRNKPCDVYVSRSSTIVLSFPLLDFLVWTKPGDESWVYAEFEFHEISNVLFYDDQIFFIDADKGLVQINFANEVPSKPLVEVVVPESEFPDLNDDQYLVDCGGDIVMVSFVPDPVEEHFWESPEIYKLDLKEKKFVHTRNLGGSCSVFLSDFRTFLVVCKNPRLIAANSIYLCKLYYGVTACYNLSTKRWSSEPFLLPSILVKDLIKYCLKSYWICRRWRTACKLTRASDWWHQ